MQESVTAPGTTAPAQLYWIPVGEGVPATTPNTVGSFCQVITRQGETHYAYYCHDVLDGVDTKYWSGVELQVKNGVYDIVDEWYEISDVILWMPLPAITSVIGQDVLQQDIYILTPQKPDQAMIDAYFADKPIIDSLLLGCQIR